jgi:putative IMPACT (imprinted ancient) family translation regulator
MNDANPQYMSVYRVNTRTGDRTLVERNDGYLGYILDDDWNVRGRVAMNDDGEPSGTAGKPILSVIQHKDLGDVLVMVIRYFGGIKLGAGGLVRAYAGATEAVLSGVERVIQQPMSQVTVTMTFADEQPLRHWCDQNGAEIGNVGYSAGVTADVSLVEERNQEFTAFCESRGMGYRFDS